MEELTSMALKTSEAVAKNRLAKMRGITRKNFNLHLKETEWRFNHRHENIYKLLLINPRHLPL